MQAQAERWAVAAMFFANGFLMGAWAPQIPLLLPRFGIGEGMVGLLILVLGLGAVGAMLFSGRMIARHGGAAVLRAFALAILPGLPLVIAAPNLWLLALAMALFGAVIGTMDVAMNAQAVDVERRLGRPIMSSSHGFWSLGGFAGAGLGGLAIEASAPLPAAIIMAGVAGVAVAGALPRIRGVAPAPGPAAAPRPLLPRDAGLWLLGMMTLFSMVPEGAVLDWGALYLTRDFAAGPALAGLGFAAFAGAMAVLRLAGDAVRSRFGAVATLRVSAWAGAAGLLAAAAAPSPGLVILCFAVSGFGMANLVPVLFSAAGNRAGLPPGAAIATVTMVGYAGILIAPSSIGAVAEVVGFRATFATLALLLAVVALLAPRAAAADARAVAAA